MAQQYDVATKLLLGRRDGALFPVLFGGPVRHWHNVELPRVENKRPDLIAESEAGRITNFEITSTNDARQQRNMLRKQVSLEDRFSQVEVVPVMLYIGKEPMRLKSPCETPYWNLRYVLMDILDLDGEVLLESEHLEDNILAILTRVDKGRVIDRVMGKLGRMDGIEREEKATLFVILSGLRDLENEIMEKVHGMLTIEDLLENRVIGPWLRDHAEKAQAEGKAEGKAEGERTVLLQLAEERFGPLPEEAVRRLAAASEPQLAAGAKSLLRARNLEEWLGCLSPIL